MERLLENKHAGRLAARFLKAYAVGIKQWGGHQDGAQFAKSMRWTHAPLIADALEKAAVQAGTSSNMSGALATVGQDLASVVRPLTVIGRLEGFRRVPALTNCITQTSGASAYWVGEGAAPGLSRQTFDRSQLSYQRLGAISVLTEELALTADPAAEPEILRDLVNAIVQKQDEAFIDPENAGSPEILPASVTRYAQQFVSTGTAVAQIDSDLHLMLNQLSNGGSDLQNATWILNPRSSAYLAGLRGSGGSPCFPGMGARGGELLGLPAITSKACLRAGSPEETILVLVDPSRVWLTERPEYDLQASKTVSLQMDDGPTNNSATGTGTTLVSMFQTDSIACKAVNLINWKPVTVDSAAVTLTKVNF